MGITLFGVMVVLVEINYYNVGTVNFGRPIDSVVVIASSASAACNVSNVGVAVDLLDDKGDGVAVVNVV